jgi:uncharacterized protein (DUF1800 family)
MKRFTGLLTAVAIALVPAAQLRGRAAALPNDEATITRVLNRATFGPRARDVDRVKAIGLSTWIDQQLHPSKIDDHAAEGLLPAFAAAPSDLDQQALRRFARQQVQTLAADKLLRAMYSERQLQEVLVDFWFNHFNVYADKGRTAEFLPEYERDVIRPHVFDRFRDLLEADAKSPAMLFYLDNWLSADPNAAERVQAQRQDAAAQRAMRRARRPGLFGGFPPPPPPARNAKTPNANANKRERGLNENYGRELLELHTLGVDGGYTQQDVINVARAFTGWTIDRDNRFRFVPALHDTGAKIVLGHTIKAGGGIDDGEKVLDIIASHPATAHHIAYQLAQRLVSDQPPPALVDRAAARFRDTKGDLREVVRTILTSREMLSAATDSTPDSTSKFKSPLQFVVSAVRTAGATIGDARPFIQALMQLGEPLYMCQPPTGYKDTADAWVSAGGLVSRMNFATRLASGNMPGVALPAGAPARDELALRIGSPEFQRF